MPSVAVDAGPLVAVLAHDDRHYAEALNFFKANQAKLVTNVAVLTEAAYLLSFRQSAARDMLHWVSQAFEVDTETAADLTRIVEIMTKYADLPADFADASLLAMCERRSITEIATLDKDFNVYQLSSGDKLRNVFYDGV